ncbi:MAG: transporter [Halorubrum sp.]
MSLTHAVMWSLHVGFAILWTGSVLFVSIAIVPSATRGAVGQELLSTVVSRLRWITRIGALVFVATGGHMAGQLYTLDTLTGTGRGHTVLTMLVLWFLITGLVEVASSKTVAGLDGNLAGAASDAKPFFYAAAGLSVALIVTAGLLANPFGL